MSWLALGAAAAGFCVRPWLVRKWLFERGTEHFGDLLLYGFVGGEGVVVLDDGRLVGGLHLDPPDATSIGAEELEAIRAVVVRALEPLSGFTVQVDLWRAEIPGATHPNDFPTAGLRRLWKERTERQTQGAPYQSSVVATITSPVPTSGDLWQDLMKARSAERLDVGAVRGFEGQLQQFADGLPRELRATVLETAALLTHLRFCVTGQTDEVDPADVDALRLGYSIADCDFVGGMEPRRGDLETAVISVTSVPATLPNNALEFVHRLDFNVRSSGAFTVWSPREAAKRLEKMRNNRIGGLRSIRSQLAQESRKDVDKSNVDAQAADLVNQSVGAVNDGMEIREAEGALVQGTDCFGDLRWTFVVSAATRAVLERQVAQVLAGLQRLRCGYVLERAGSVPALHASLPGHAARFPRRLGFSGSGFAAVTPDQVPWIGNPVVTSQYFPRGSPAVLVGRVREASKRKAPGSPFYFSPFVGDVGHTMVVGPTGAGKSVFLATLASQFLQYRDARVAVLDVGRSAEMFAEISGGNFYPLSVTGAEGYSLGALSGLSREGSEGLAATKEWLALVLDLRGVDVTPAVSHTLESKLRDLQPEPALHTMRALVDSLQGEIAQALAPYAAGGIYGELFDGAMPDDARRVNVFELESLLTRSDEVAMPAARLILDYLWRRTDPKIPTLMIVDEVHRLLGNSALGKWLIQMLREARKRNVAMILGTQSVADLVAVGLDDVVRQSIKTQIHVPDRGAVASDRDRSYGAMGVSRKARTVIATGKEKFHYVCVQEGRARRFDLDLSQPELDFLTGTRGGLERWRDAVEVHGRERAMDCLLREGA